MADATPTFLSLFSGIGGFDLALERSGWRCVGQVEIDSFCAHVLAARFPHAPRWPDVRQWQGDRHEPPDLLIGGFPCQDFSVAGKRAGLVGFRGTLFWEIVRIAKALTPTWGLFENVPGLLSSHRGRDFWAVLQGLRDCWPAVGWRILDSRYFGVPQRRRRVFLVCGASEAAIAQVLFESEGGGGHPAAGRETGAGIAASLTSGSHRPGVSDPGRRTPKSAGSDSGGDPTALERADSPLGKEPQPIVFQCHGGNVGPMGTLREGDGGLTSGVPFVTHALSAEGADASEDGTGRGTPLIWPIQEVGKRENKKQHGEGMGLSDQDVMYTLQAGAEHGIATPMSVRRLTPMECERLQNFPDGFTCLCQPIENYAADSEQAAWNCKCPDGPRYRALGNAVTVSVVEWIGRRLKAAK